MCIILNHWQSRCSKWSRGSLIPKQLLLAVFTVGKLMRGRVRASSKGTEGSS